MSNQNLVNLTKEELGLILDSLISLELKTVYEGNSGILTEIEAGLKMDSINVLKGKVYELENQKRKL